MCTCGLQTEGINNGERNNFIFSRRACGGGNFNGSFVTQFNGGDHDGTSVLGKRSPQTDAHRQTQTDRSPQTDSRQTQAGVYAFRAFMGLRSRQISLRRLVCWFARVGRPCGPCRTEPLRSQRLSMDRTGADVFQRTASLRPNYRSPQKFKPARLPTLPFEAYSASTRSFLQSSQLPDITPAALPAQGDQTRPRTSSSFMSGEWGCMPCVLCPLAVCPCTPTA